MEINLVQFHQVVLTWHHLFEDNKQYLSTLDQVIGDGDHGTNMNRGFTKVATNYKTDFINFQQVFHFIGMTLLASIGGASGPLYGMAFINFAKEIGLKTEFSFIDWKNMVHSFGQTITQLGKSQIHEKTMVDVWIPLEHFLEPIQELDSNQKKVIEAEIDLLVANTIPMKATKGRAAFLQERSIGHVDPGAVSTGILLKTLLNAF